MILVISDSNDQLSNDIIDLCIIRNVKYCLIRTVCKDCEFRYICTDCRAYVEDPDDILSKPLKCGYNPYTGEWSEWSTNPLKQKAIDFYGMNNFVNWL